MTTSEIAKRSPSTALERFSSVDRLFVKQQRKWFEVLLSAELKNAYEILDEAGAPKFSIREVGHGAMEFLARMLLGPTRPFRMSVTDAATDDEVLVLKRPFRFIFHRLEVRTDDDTLLGSIEREWSWIRRIYQIRDEADRVIARFVGPFFKPWTFELRNADGTPIGAIKKKWSGLGREMFTDADNFSVELEGVTDNRLKAIVVGAVALIDVVHFERTKR